MIANSLLFQQKRLKLINEFTLENCRYWALPPIYLSLQTPTIFNPSFESFFATFRICQNLLTSLRTAFSEWNHIKLAVGRIFLFNSLFLLFSIETQIVQLLALKIFPFSLSFRLIDSKMYRALWQIEIHNIEVNNLMMTFFRNTQKNESNHKRVRME